MALDDQRRPLLISRRITCYASFHCLPNQGLAVAAGIPWFLVLIGCDTLITAYQNMLFQPEVASAGLQANIGIHPRRDL